MLRRCSQLWRKRPKLREGTVGQHGRPVFTHQRQDGNPRKPISVVAANKRIKKVFSEYDIKCKNPSSHTLRKTFGLRVYEVYNRCEDALILLSQIFNHKDISVTRRYIGITERRIKNAYLSLSSGKAIYS